MLEISRIVNGANFAAKPRAALADQAQFAPLQQCWPIITYAPVPHSPLGQMLLSSGRLRVCQRSVPHMQSVTLWDSLWAFHCQMLRPVLLQNLKSLCSSVLWLALVTVAVCEDTTSKHL